MIERDWAESANCLVDSPEDTSFIRKPDEVTERRWRRICKQCPVQAQCLEWADEHKPTGVYIAGEWRDVSEVDSIKAILNEDSYVLSYPGDKYEGYEVIARQELDSGRWSRWDLVVIRDPDGGLWGWEDESPLTEMQEVERYDDYDVFPVKAIQTTAYEKAE